MSKVAIIDSGIGGAAIARQVRRLLPRADIVYYCDNANFPYGDKTRDRLEAIALNAVDEVLTQHDVQAIVLGCNTLTAAAVDSLRSRYPRHNIVGTEPAVKTALAYTAGNCLVACTSYTAAAERIRKRFTAHNVFFCPFPRLADMVEFGAKDKDIAAYVSYVYENYGVNCDCVVLGCTHFILARPALSRVFIHQKLFDGASGVASRVKTLVDKRSGGGTVTVMLSAPDQAKKERLASLLR